LVEINNLAIKTRPHPNPNVSAKQAGGNKHNMKGAGFE
jgi:hypothetical protein